MHQGSDQDFPTLIFGSDQIGPGHSDFLKKDFVELGIARHLDQRSNRHARRVHIHGQTAYPPVFGRIGVGADKKLDEIRPVGKAGPDFLAVDHKIVSVLYGPRLHRRQVRPRIRLGQALTPDFVARQNPGQIALLLLLGPPMNQGRTRHHQPERIGKAWGVGSV